MEAPSAPLTVTSASMRGQAAGNLRRRPGMHAGLVDELEVPGGVRRLLVHMLRPPRGGPGAGRRPRPRPSPPPLRPLPGQPPRPPPVLPRGARQQSAPSPGRLRTPLRIRRSSPRSRGRSAPPRPHRPACSSAAMTLSRLVPMRPSSVPPAGTDQDVGSHLRGEFDGAVGDLGAVRDDHQPDCHSAAPAAARRISALETAPGSRWPMLRSPR